jgi:hypothetical protein
MMSDYYDKVMKDEMTGMFLSIYQGMMAVVGAQTARLNGADEKDPAAVPEATHDGVMAMRSLTRAISKVMAPAKPESDHDFAACVKGFVNKIDPIITGKFDSKPKDFILHVTGYAVMTNQDWDVALGDLLPGSIWSKKD